MLFDNISIFLGNQFTIIKLVVMNEKKVKKIKHFAKKKVLRGFEVALLNKLSTLKLCMEKCF